MNNVCGVIITSNYKTDGLYLPANDRRHYVTWSPLTINDFAAEYFQRLYKWFADGGNEHVTAYLHSIDLSMFDAKAPPEKTAEFWDVVDANRAPEDAELADLIDSMHLPRAVTLQALITKAEAMSSPTSEGISDWLKERKNRRQVPHRLEAVGYVPVRNDAATDGLWNMRGSGKRCTRAKSWRCGIALSPRGRCANERQVSEVSDIWGHCRPAWGPPMCCVIRKQRSNPRCGALNVCRSQ